MSTFWGPGNIFGADEARHFKFDLLLNVKSAGITCVKVLQHGGALRVT